MTKTAIFFFSVFFLTRLDAQAIDSIVQKEAAAYMQNKGAVGLSVGVLKDGRMYTYTFGSVEKGIQKRPAEQTMFAIASISKTFTGLLLAKADRENKVKLDDDIRKYLDGDYPNLEYQGHPIKLWHLISHVSRLPFILSDSSEKAGYTRADFYKDLHNVKIDTIPGIKFQYSNSAAQLLGYILEKVYHKSYEALLKEKVTGPLHMNDTKVKLRINETANFAKGYNEDGTYNPQTYTFMEGAGGIKTTAKDMLKYISLQMDESNPAVLLSHQETWGFDMGGGSRYSCGLNWQIVKKADGPRRIAQEGEFPNYLATAIFSPELKTGIVILANSFIPGAESKMADNILKQIEPRMP